MDTTTQTCGICGDTGTDVCQPVEDSAQDDMMDQFGLNLTVVRFLPGGIVAISTVVVEVEVLRPVDGFVDAMSGWGASDPLAGLGRTSPFAYPPFSTVGGRMSRVL